MAVGVPVVKIDETSAVADTNTHVTASWAPTADTLYIAYAVAAADGTNANPTAITAAGNGITYPCRLIPFPKGGS